MDPRTFEAFRAGAQSLSDTMRAPSNPPDIVVLDRIYDDENQQLKPLSTQQDLWVSTADGRFSSPPIPIRVGTESNMQIFYVSIGRSLKGLGLWLCLARVTILTRLRYTRRFSNEQYGSAKLFPATLGRQRCNKLISLKKTLPCSISSSRSSTKNGLSPSLL